MMNIEELRKIFCEDGLYAVCVENGNLVSHYRIMCLRKNGAACNQVNHLIPTRVLVKGGEITCKILK
ncbi:hypothetical protein FMO95_00980 [Escherichia coli]|nr:hypothetical protein [Escherichia coli]